MIISLLFGCSLLGIYTPPKWKIADVQIIEKELCATGSSKVRGSLKTAKNTASHRATMKLAPYYSQKAYDFAEYLDIESGFDLNIIQTANVHGYNKAFLKTKQNSIHISHNFSHTKKVWVMNCIQIDLGSITAVVTRSWLKKYHKRFSSEKTQEAQGDTMNEELSPSQILGTVENINDKTAINIEETIKRLSDQYLVSRKVISENIYAH